MTLPASGSISLTQVLAELQTANAGRTLPISLGDADVRALAGVPSGAISLSNLYGKTAYTPSLRIFTSSGSFTAPVGMTSFQYLIVGGGGGGGGGGTGVSKTGGTGGGGGTITRTGALG